MTSTASPYSPNDASSDQASVQHTGDPASAQSGYTESGYGQSGYTESGYGQSGYTEPGYRQSDYPQSGSTGTGTGYAPGGYGQPGYTAPQQRPGAYPTPFGEKTLSYVSFWLGVASVVLSPTVLVPVAAIVLGFMARTREPAGRTWATWGIVLGFVMAFGWFVALIVGGVAALAALPFVAFL